MSTTIAYVDETLNPIGGCRVARLEDGTVHPGCQNCFARMMAQRGLPGLKKYVPVRKWDGTVVEFKDRWLVPLTWKGSKRCMVCSMSDLWIENVTDDARLILHGVMILCSQHTFLDLTKRPAEMARWLGAHSPADCFNAAQAWAINLETSHNSADFALLQRGIAQTSARWSDVLNIHRYVSASDQGTVDELGEELLRVPASRRGISLEPLVGEVTRLPKVDRIIVGCESGQRRRRCQLEWVHGVVRLCAEKALFVKQLDLGGRVSHDPAEWPEWARRREM